MIAIVSEEVSHHIFPIEYSYGALNKLKDLYDSHSKLELLQLQVKLSILESKDDDIMDLIFEIKDIMHDIGSIVENI